MDELRAAGEVAELARVVVAVRDAPWVVELPTDSFPLFLCVYDMLSWSRAVQILVVFRRGKLPVAAARALICVIGLRL